MKKLFLLLLPVLMFSNCGKELETLADLSYTVQFEIQAGLNPFTIWELPINNIPNNNNSFLNAANVSPEEIERIVGKTGIMSTVFSGANLDFIQNITVEIFSDDPDDATEILYRDQVNENTENEVGLNASLPNVQRHLMDETFGIIITIRPRRSATQTIDARLDFVLGAL